MPGLKYILGCLLLALVSERTVGTSDNYWNGRIYKLIEDSILQNIPIFKDRDFSIIDFGALADWDSKTGEGSDCFQSINAAINECNQQGGGRVIVPPGSYLMKGPLLLKSNVEFHLEENAYIFIDKSDRKRFLTGDHDSFGRVLSRFEGTWVLALSPLIYAIDQQNIAITGKGVFVASGNWMQKEETAINFTPPQKTPNKGQVIRYVPFKLSTNIDAITADTILNSQVLRQLGRHLAPLSAKTFDMNGWIPPQPFFQPIRCKNILIEGISFLNGQFWNINPVLCDNVLIRGVCVMGNRDGIDPESCNNVIIEDVKFSNWDDNIAIKSGRDNEAFPENGGRASSNIIIRNCHFKKGSVGAVSIGSENSGGVFNVFVENCTADRVQIGLYIKSGCLRNANIHSIYIRNFKLRECEKLIHIRTDYEGSYNPQSAPYPPKISNVFISDMKADNITDLQRESPVFVRIEGQTVQPVTHIYLRNISGSGDCKPLILNNVSNIHFKNVTWHTDGNQRELQPF